MCSDERRRGTRAAAGGADGPNDGIAVVVLTHNREHLLRQCVENVLLRTSPATREIVIWDNALDRRNARAISRRSTTRGSGGQQRREHRTERVCARFPMTTSAVSVELDDDVVERTSGWDATLLDAYRRLPRSGSWQPISKTTPTTSQPSTATASGLTSTCRPWRTACGSCAAPPVVACAITSRALNERVGGFRQHPKQVFWLEDAGLYRGHRTPRVRARLCLRTSESITRVARTTRHDSGGEGRVLGALRRRRARRAAIKRIVFRVPFFRRLNARYAWFVAPS